MGYNFGGAKNKTPKIAVLFLQFSGLGKIIHKTLVRQQLFAKRKTVTYCGGSSADIVFAVGGAFLNV